MHGSCDRLEIGSGWATRRGDANVVVHSQSQSDRSCTTMAYGSGSLQRQARFTEAADYVEPGVVHQDTIDALSLDLVSSSGTSLKSEWTYFRSQPCTANNESEDA